MYEKVLSRQAARRKTAGRPIRQLGWNATFPLTKSTKILLLRKVGKMESRSLDPAPPNVPTLNTVKRQLRPMAIAVCVSE
jgi:hypothetical protein